MRTINLDEFRNRIKDAQIICAPEFGFFVCFDKKNPYKKEPFSIEEKCELYHSEHQFGSVLKLKKEGKTAVVAFVFNSNFLPAL